MATSEGPANPSIPTMGATMRLAADVYALPGPTMTSTGRIDLGAVGHRGDGSGTADAVELVDLGERGRREDRVVDRSVGARRRADDDLAHAGDARRHRGHQQTRREGRDPAGHVAAGPIHGNDQLAHVDPRPFVAGFLLALGLVPGEDLVPGELQGGPKVRIDARERSLPLRPVHAQRLDHRAVELGRVAAECLVTTAHEPRRRPGRRSSRSARLRRPAGPGARAQIRVGASYIDASEQ